MFITDIEGHPIEVTNLQLTLMQADDSRHFEHFNPDFVEFAAKRRAYWEDIYQKLLQLQAAGAL